MSDKDKNKTLVNNIFFVVLIVLLAFGAVKSANLENISPEELISNSKLSNMFSKEEPVQEEIQRPNIFDEVQPERVRQKIDYATASEFIDRRTLSGTEVMELAKRRATAEYFKRNGNKILIFYPTTGSEAMLKAFMRDFTKLRNEQKHNSKLVFIPIETSLNISEKSIKNSSDRVFYNIKKDCNKFCIINVPAKSLTTLKSPEFGSKTFEVVEAIVNSL